MRYCYNLYTNVYRFPRGFDIPDEGIFLDNIPKDDSIIFSVDPSGTLDIDDAFSFTVEEGFL